jgi:hypothetical protein
VDNELAQPEYRHTIMREAHSLMMRVVVSDGADDVCWCGVWCVVCAGVVCGVWWCGVWWCGVWCVVCGVWCAGVVSAEVVCGVWCTID